MSMSLMRLSRASMTSRGGVTGRRTDPKASDQAESRASTLEELFASRFSSLPADCGQDAEPGVSETEEWRHWVSRETTPDQRRIERYLKSLRLTGKHILHVGIGNSGFAKAFASKCQIIKGLTIADEEITHAKSLYIKNYQFQKESKYSDCAITGRYDIIVDNNPTGYACCWRHFAFMVRKYRAALNRGGIILTDKVGLSWISSKQPRNSQWSFDFQDWKAVARTQGFDCVAIDDFLIAWVDPGVKVPRTKHYILQSIRKPADLIMAAKRTLTTKARNKLAHAFRRRDDRRPGAASPASGATRTVR